MRGRPGDRDVVALLKELDAFGDGEILRFDVRARSWSSGFGSGEIAKLHSRWRRGAAERLWTIAALVSADGFEREAAVEAVELRRSTIRLIALRSTDWVREVRQAALLRLAAAPVSVLLDVLPLAEVLTRDRARSGDLDALVEQRLSSDDLKAAAASVNPLARRAAWRRLIARGAVPARDLIDGAACDPDVMVRGLAAHQLGELAPGPQHELADVLVGDPVGWIAGLGLQVLVETDGTDAITDALTAPNATLRRRARSWAHVRGVDARAVYLARLEQDPVDELALVALAEISAPEDVDVLTAAAADRRTRVRAAALRALGRLDPPAARELAIKEFVSGGSGRVARAASAVLRSASLSTTDVRRLAEVAEDEQRPTGLRLRALSLLRPSRWQHLATVMRCRDAAGPSFKHALDDELRDWITSSARISRGPDPDVRATITALLPGLSDPVRNSIEFTLRTTT